MNIYLNERLTIKGNAYCPESEGEFTEVIIDLLKALETFKYHLDARIIYSSEGFRILMANFKEIDDMVKGVFSDSLDALRSLLLDISAVDWYTNKQQRDDILYFHQLNLGSETSSVNNTSVAEACEHKFITETSALLNLSCSEYNQTNPVHVNRSNVVPPEDMKMISVESFCKKNEVITYIIKNREPRVYNHNPKHGENGSGVIQNKGEDVSPLECSIDEAKTLLIHAVTTSAKNEFYVYDEARSKYITYKTDHQHTFHGYHPINQNEVPMNVRKFLRDQ